MRDELRPQWPLVELAKAQYGVASHTQIEALGYSTTAIGRAIWAGRLHVMHRGVYAVGHPVVSREGRCLAAVLAGGTGAMLSHAAAGWLWGLLRKWPGDLDVTTPVRGHRKAGVVAHHSTILEARDRATAERVPVTAVPRTLLDLAALRRPWLLDEAVERAERLDLLDIGDVDELLDRSGRHRGRAKLRNALEIYRPAVFSRAKSERRFLSLVKSAGLPTPALNTFVDGHEIDAFWDDDRFAVEVDGWETHGTRKSFERDPVRVEDLKLAGIDVIRITARRIEREPKEVGARLARLLRMRRAERASGPHSRSGRG